MSLIQEAAFMRLLPKYEKAFGEPPPLGNVSVDEALEYMRNRLNEHPDRDFAFLEGPDGLSRCVDGLH